MRAILLLEQIVNRLSYSPDNVWGLYNDLADDAETLKSDQPSMKDVDLAISALTGKQLVVAIDVCGHQNPAEIAANLIFFDVPDDIRALDQLDLAERVAKAAGAYELLQSHPIQAAMA